MLHARWVFRDATVAVIILPLKVILEVKIHYSLKSVGLKQKGGGYAAPAYV